jgi:hypothetical protein
VSDPSNGDDGTAYGPVLIFVDGQVFVYLGGKDPADLREDIRAALEGELILHPLEVAAVRPDGFQANSVGWLTIRADRVGSVAITAPPVTHAHAATGYVFG